MRMMIYREAAPLDKLDPLGKAPRLPPYEAAGDDLGVRTGVAEVGSEHGDQRAAVGARREGDGQPLVGLQQS